MTKALAYAFPPGDFLAEELEEREWSQADFAAIIDRPAQLVSGIISGKKEITEQTAAQFGAALGTSAEYWLNLQSTYQLWLQGQDPRAQEKLDRVRLRAQMGERGSVSLLRQRGFIRATDLDDQYREFCDLLEIESLDQEVPFLAAARRANVHELATAHQVTWLACARRIARDRTVDPFNVGALQDMATSLTQRVRLAQDWAQIPEMFAGVGVRLVYVEAFPANKISGASFLLDGDPSQPVIALSGLGKRFDKVMFTLLHEMAHLVLGHVTPTSFPIDEGQEAEDECEENADRQAARWALPLQDFDPPSHVRRPWVMRESERQGVHPLIVIGTLQHQGVLDWRSELVKGAEQVDEYLRQW